MQTADDLKQKMCSSLTQMGDNHYQLGQMEKAVDYYRQALAIAREVSERVMQRRVLINLALCASRQADYVRAVDAYNQAVLIAQKPSVIEGQPSAAGEVQLLLDLGKEFYRQADLEKARSYLDTAAEYAKAMRLNGDRTAERLENLAHAYLGIIACGLGQIEKIHDHSPAALVYGQTVSDDLLIGVALTGMGLYETMTGAWLRASGALESAIEKLRTTKEAWLEAEARAYLCYCLAESGRPDSALELVAQLPGRDDETVSLRARSVALTAHGLAEAFSGQADQALVTCRDALALAQEMLQHGDLVGDWMAARALYGEGLAHAANGDLAEAQAAYRKSMALTDSTNDRVLHVRTMVAMGEAMLNSNPQEARITFDHALSMAQQINNTLGQTLALSGLGQANARLGRMGDAVTAFERAYAMADKNGDVVGQFRIAIQSGDAHRAAGQRDIAVDNYEQAIQLARTANIKRLEAQALGGLGMCLIDTGDPGKAVQAIQYLMEAEAAAQASGDQRLSQLYFGALGSAYAASGQTNKAIDHYRQAVANARETGDRAGEGVWLGNLANLYAYIDQPNRAVEAYQKALAISEETGDRISQGRLMINLGLVYSELDYLDDAINALRKARAIFGELGDTEMLDQADNLLDQLGG